MCRVGGGGVKWKCWVEGGGDGNGHSHFELNSMVYPLFQL